MITWATTVAPQTESSHVLESYFVGAVAEINNSITKTENYGSTSWQNWSRTTGSNIYSVTIGAPSNTGGSSENSFVSVLGTTDDVSWAVRGDGLKYRYSYTIRSVLNVTSTQTTRQYTYRKTGTTQSSFGYPVTSITYGTTFTGVSYAASSTLTTTGVGTIAETCLSTTTVSNETVRTPILATVVVADKNEVIWAIDSSQATQMSGLRAATAFGTTATRTTIMPWTKTVVTPQGNSNQTTAFVLPLVSQSLNYVSTNLAQVESSRIVEYGYFPHKTEAFLFNSLHTAATHLDHAIVEQESLTATVSKLTETVFATSYVQMPVTQSQQQFNATTTTTGTFTRESTQSYAETSTNSATFPIAAASQPNETGSFELYTWTGTLSLTTSNNLTTFAKTPQAVTVVPPQNIAGARALEFYQGVYGHGAVAAGYSCQQEIVAFGILPEISRSVSSLMPKVVTYQKTYPEDDGEGGTYPGLEEGGKMTISSLSATIQPSSTTQTSSFKFQPFGAPRLVAAAMQTRSAVNGLKLGASESVYQTLPAGVYSVDSNTFSTSGGCRSWAQGGNSQAALIPLSFIAPTTDRNGASPIWWTVSRNSHQSIAGIL